MSMSLGRSRWSALPPLQQPREVTCAIAIPHRAEVMVIGGHSGWTVHPTVETLRVHAPDRWHWRAPMLRPYKRPRAAFFAGCVWVTGGDDVYEKRIHLESFCPPLSMHEAGQWTLVELPVYRPPSALIAFGGQLLAIGAYILL